MGKLPLSCWDLPSLSHRFSAHCRKSTLRKNPSVSHATVSSDNLAAGTHQTNLPRNPAGTSYSRKSKEQKSCFQNQVETLPTPVRSSAIHSGHLFTPVFEIQCNCSHKSGFLKFFFAIFAKPGGLCPYSPVLSSTPVSHPACLKRGMQPPAG